MEIGRPGRRAHAARLRIGKRFVLRLLDDFLMVALFYEFVVDVIKCLFLIYCNVDGSYEIGTR